MKKEKQLNLARHDMKQMCVVPGCPGEYNHEGVCGGEAPAGQRCTNAQTSAALECHIECHRREILGILTLAGGGL